MPIKINKAKERTRTVTVEYAGETAAIIYYPGKITKTFIREAAESGDGLERATTQLVGLIADWEVVDDDGKPLPITEEVLAGFPLDFLTAIQQKINEVEVPGESNGASSSTT